ncbi:aminoglycoside phosphotransferase family protein [Phytomonospora sp. NPDC050363]|uniref:aminoglycoside phosphotransferase family protein n=1 Tax=Phytomonospora sp. NPDC050363 TaxID=3155642 RepID=UPI0033E4409F
MIAPVVRTRANTLGEKGRRWLAELPSLVEELGRDWGFADPEPLAGGTAALVARVRLRDGSPAVLKIAVPDEEAANEIAVLTAAGGRGYVRLLEADPARLAMLQPELGPSMVALGMPPEEAITALCATLREAWTLPTAVGRVQDTAALLATLVEDLYGKLREPCPRHVVELALEYARRRSAGAGAGAGAEVVVHGDPHPGNALRRGDGFAFVDPVGIRCDPAYDLGVILRDWPERLLGGDAGALARDWCARLSAGSDVDHDAIWEWGYLERVSTGLHLTDLGLGDEGAGYLASAERLAR